ncbi:MAG: sigma-70 family RNA polymerase sigma factor [Bacteroidales bacterium]|nr:sigma-70 family RNA polymerase sigma factor [Bacteroidales bacterium]
MSEFKISVMKELTNQQVRFTPHARLQEQVSKAETLFAEIEADRVYPYQYICFRLTDFRPETHTGLMLAGSDLKHDLALFVKLVERSLPPLPIELAAEPMLTLEEVSKQFNVSTKTVNRWWVLGLTARHVLRNGRKQLGFPQSAVAAFAAKHRDQVERGARFSHLTDTEKDRIILSARNFAAQGGSLTDISRKIADELGRSAEAVRYTIKNFDRAHPESAVFPDHSARPLDAASKTMIYSDFQEGQPVDLIAKRFGRTRSSMYRVINEVRAERITSEPVDYIYNAEFDDPTREAEFVGPMPLEEEFFGKVKAMRPPKDVEAHMAHLYERPLLSREQEAHLFRKMNYLKHRLNQRQQELDPMRARVQELREIEDYRSRIQYVRDLLIECNQRLVHNLATKHLQPGQSLDELKSDANISLMRAVEKFDYGRGNKFSTYATWAIMKNFARSIPGENTRRARYVTGHEDLFESKADIRTDEQEVLATADAAKSRVNRLLEYLDPRTRDVIRMRIGLNGNEEMTLEQIGQHFGITKERVRQINVRGMKQLRERALEEDGGELF